MNAKAVLDREFLEMRCRIIDLAASLDRIERGEGRETISGDPRMESIRGGLALLADSQVGRAERVQLHFSDEYRVGWRTELAV